MLCCISRTISAASQILACLLFDEKEISKSGLLTNPVAAICTLWHGAARRCRAGHFANGQ